MAEQPKDILPMAKRTGTKQPAEEKCPFARNPCHYCALAAMTPIRCEGTKEEKRKCPLWQR